MTSDSHADCMVTFISDKRVLQSLKKTFLNNNNSINYTSYYWLLRNLDLGKCGLVVGGWYENNRFLPYPTSIVILPPPKRIQYKKLPKQHFDFQLIRKTEDRSKLYYYQFCDIKTD